MEPDADGAVLLQPHPLWCFGSVEPLDGVGGALGGCVPTETKVAFLMIGRAG